MVDIFMGEIFERLKRLLLIPECKDRNYRKEPIPYELEQQVFMEQDGKCYLHGGRVVHPHYHHIIPDESSTRDNLVMLCNICNYWIHLMLANYKGYKKTRFFGYYSYR